MTLIIVPFYKNPHLAKSMGSNLSSLASEILEQNAEVLFVNDSPADLELKQELKRQTENLRLLGINVTLLENEENLGFVKSSNRGLLEAQRRGAHALLLNSDVLMAAGCLKEMLRVLQLDSMFGMVCPRSNNASIASLPFATRNEKRSFEEAHQNFQVLSPYLDDYQIAPVAVGFCMLIRDIILIELGVLDEIYSPGYNEENDFCFRANRIGFSAVLANKAFAYHESSSSFGPEQFSLYDQRNRTVLIERYQEYDRAVGDYLESATFRYEELLIAALRSSDGVLSVAIDFTHFKTAFNGTYEFGLELLESLVKSENRDFSLAVIGEEHGLRFHKIVERFPSVEVLNHDTDKVFDVIIKPAQTFDFEDYILLSRKALFSFVFMLDTIALDSAYIRSDKLKQVWEVAPKLLDGILFISDFSKEQFNRRFPKALSETEQQACQLSVSYKDYPEIFDTSEVQHTDELVNNPLPKDYFFVIGNHYQHKFLQPTIEFLSKQFPDYVFLGLGGESKQKDNIRIIKSGALAASRIDMIYRQSKAVIFPSFYEGFGFPIPKGLSIGKLVIARDSALNQQMKERWEGPGRIELYRTSSELQELVQKTIEDKLSAKDNWQAQEKSWDWAAFADQLMGFVKATIAKDPLAQKAKQRLEIISGFKPWQAAWAAKEKERVAVSDELHMRNLAFLAGEERIKALERKIQKLEQSKAYKMGCSILDGISSLPGLGGLRHREIKSGRAPN